MSEQERDRYLQDYSAPFRHATSEWSVPASWEKEYRLLEKKEQAYKKNGIDVTATVDENGNLTIRQSTNVIQVTSENRFAFMSMLFALPPKGPHAGGGLGVANPGQTSAPINIGGTHIENDDRPIVQEHMKQNLETLERWAKASSESYPRHR